jgi:hypothetical protein
MEKKPALKSQGRQALIPWIMYIQVERKYTLYGFVDFRELIVHVLCRYFRFDGLGIASRKQASGPVSFWMGKVAK